MNWLKRWFVRHFITQDEVDTRIRQMIIEARCDHNMPPSHPLKPGSLGTSDHQIPSTRYYVPPEPKK